MYPLDKCPLATSDTWSEVISLKLRSLCPNLNDQQKDEFTLWVSNLCF